MQIKPPPEKFISTLLEIRNHYAPLVEKYGKLYREALDNLTHVEALLLNWGLQESTNSNGSVQITEEIRTSPDQETTNGTLASTAKTEPEVVANNTELPKVNNIKAESIFSTNQVTLAEENLSNGSGRLDVSPDETSSDEAANVKEPNATTEDVIATQESDIKDGTGKTPEVGSELAQPIINESTLEEDKPLVTKSSSKEQALASPDKSLFGKEIPMLSDYGSLNRTEAVEKLLQEHKGNVCHIDFIVRSLYGELEPKAWKVVKGRVQSTLTYGKESLKWSLVPGKPGYYTVDLKLLNSKNKGSSSKKSQTKNEKPQTQAQADISTLSSSVPSQTPTEKSSPQAQAYISPDDSTKPSQTKSQKPNPQAKTNAIPMKGEFEGKFLIDAISLLLEKNKRKVFDANEIINKLYGELSSEQLPKVRSAVLNELSRGFRTGRFSRVPQEKGLYIWDAKLLPD
ncbi:hypothetical protein [Nostoc sp. FACHB-110]|uniref:hypothetical protein n=1 Tax=Nostoc sp. FACHB-110 TaxID=2692834 RepID=UPI0016895794|nr:hypothetical protein [Nostoc sp. FACHB-110]MBD2440955.1 hypothetical protein [Nostoc sp. FACHB-110]